MKKPLLSRILSLALVAALLASFAVPVSAAPGTAQSGISWKESNRAVSLDYSDRLAETHTEPTPAPTDVVRVSIVLEDKPTVQAGFSTMDIAQNAEAMAYSAKLQAKQETVAQKISTQALGGKTLDVVWNLTLVGNVISANVPYGKIEAIERVSGVKGVVLERTYEPCVVSKEETSTPQMFTSSGMIGSNMVWSNGYTGAGSRIAIIDTGTDTDHQSFDNGAYLYALQQNADKAGMSEEAYINSLDLLDQEEIASVLTKLNAYERNSELTAEKLYVSQKLAYGYNYKDNSLYLTHDQDKQSEHGSHVAGISAANRYIPQGDGYVDALENVFVAGVAPDAQIITMKIFGITGGTSDADYMAAIEDAILLGCDSVNLSIGTSNAGEPYYDYYAELLDYMTETDTVVVASAGNAGHWAQTTMFQYPYNDDVAFATHGAPGSYANLLSVASVENAGSVGYGFRIGDLNVVYNEILAYSNSAMSGLDVSADKSGTEYDYIFIDGLGEAEDYEGIDLTGKVVICSRGTLTYASKANNAISRGAAALVVYNNTSGIVNMDLTGYNYTAPVVSILQSEGAAIRERSTEQKTDAGLTYFTGKMIINGKKTVSTDGSEYYTMSSFSSWGVPGNLSLKPEITAPGGQIYSVYGSTPEGGGSTQYEVMSGTSMAAPQVTGMAALVAQYIRETGLAGKLDISPRHLAQSLLMSTAVPMREEASGGNYYSLLNQGAGLGRVDLATSAQSYIKVEGQDDYKVKAELGDDPDRTGVYQFSFSINNMTDKAQSYALSADTFRQDVFEHMEDSQIYLLDTWTADLPSVATFTAEGATILEEESLSAYDLNGDGETNALDADFLLEYVLGNETELKAEGDINGDGTVDSFDAHVLLTLLDGKTSVTVPASGSVTVHVTLALTQDAKDFLDTWTPDGTYVEAYVYATAIADAEGSVGTTHSIPVLAFYGNWTDPNMFDRGTWVEMANGVSDMVPYLYQIIGNGNALTIDYGNGNEMYFGGNPVLPDETFLPERNAFNNASDDVLVGQYFTLIRNAAASKLLLTNADTGEVYIDQELGEVAAAYYDVNYGVWQYTEQGVMLDWAGTDAEGNPLPEGTTVELSVVAAPAYYRNADGSFDYDALGKGAYLTTPITIDNTAPEASSIALDLLSGSKLTVTARDNRYVAAAVLLNAQGTSVLASATPNQTEPNVEVTVDLDISGVSGRNFLVAVVDYANNMTTYEVELGMQEIERPYFTVIDWDNWQYLGLDHEGNATVIADCTRGEPQAAEYVDGYVFEIDDGDSLYVADNDDLTTFTYIGELDSDHEYNIRRFLDLAYNVDDGKLYGLFYADLNDSMAPYLCTIDMFDGTMNVLAELPVDVMNMAIDNEGTFYSTGFNDPTMYTYTVESVTAEQPSMTNEGWVSYFGSTNWCSLAWDHNTNKLYYAFPNALLEVDPETFEPTLVGGDWLMYRMCGLFIAPNGGGSMFDPTDTVSHMEIDYAEARTLVGHNYMLTATVRPWNVSDKTVTWTSSDPTVATVDDRGLVVGISEGTAVITATSVLDPTKSVSCTMKVETLNKKLNGIVWDAEGNVWFSEFNVNDPANYTKLTEEPCEAKLASTAITEDGTLYAASVDTTSGALRSKLYTVDPETFQPTEIGLSTDGYSDIAPAPHLNDGSIAASYGGNFLLVDPTTGDYLEDWIFYMFGFNLVGIAYAGSEPYVDLENDFDTYIDWYFLVDTAGYIYLLGWLEDIYGEPFYLEHPSTTGGIFTVVNAQSDTPYFSSLYYDGEFLYYSSFNSNKDVSTFYAIDTLNNRKAYNLGNFGKGVWPMGGLMELDSIPTNSSVTGVEITATPKPMNDSATMQKVGAESKAVALNSISVQNNIVAPLSAGSYEGESQQVTVEITAAEASTNGRMSVSFDADALTLKTVTGTTEAFAYTTGEGTVELAYAAKTALSGEDVVATLIFDLAKVTSEELTVTVSYSEVNDDASELEETIRVTLPHNYVAVVTEPTCTEGGYTTYTCTICGDSYVADETEALGHSWSEWTTVEEATCTEDGTEQRTCGTCGQTETRVVEAAGHSYESVVTAPTCTEMGYTTHTCHICGDTYTSDHVNPTGHVYEKVVTEPTCTEDGYTTYTCSCGHSYISDLVEASGHSYELTTVEPTCTKPGYTVNICSVCGHNYIVDVLDPVDHSYEAVVIAPTCTEGGYTTYTCTVCGDTYSDDYTDPTGHSFGQWTVTTEPTCTEQGVETRTCACGQTETRQVEAKGHAWSEWTVIAEVGCFTDGEEIRTCSVCGENELRTMEKNADNCPSKAFTDLDADQWYHEAVDYVLGKGLMNGMGSGLFAPNGSLTRAQMVIILYRLEGEPSVEGLENPFADVPADKWYADAIIWAASEEIVTGVTATAFMPEAAITREQIAVILHRYTGEEQVEEDFLKTYTDADSISDYARDAMNWAVATGLITGDTATTLTPKNTATRAQIATILMRYCETFH